MKYSSEPKIKWLIDYFMQAKETNPAYSLRAFSSRIGVSAGFLSQVFQGKKELSDSLRNNILDRLKIDGEQRKRILSEIAIYKQKIHEAKKFQKRLLDTMFDDYIEKINLDADEYIPLIEWYHDAIFHSLDRHNKRKTIDDIASELNLPYDKLEEALKRLEDNELITRNEDESFSKNFDTYGFYADSNSADRDDIKRGFYNNQEELLKLLHYRMFERTDSSNAHVSTTYLNIPRGQVITAYGLIENFIRDVEKYYSKETAESEDIFALNIQLIDLGK